MESQPASYKFLMSLDTLVDLETEAALNHVGMLIDISKDLGKVEGLQRAFQLSDELQKRQLSAGQRAILEYFSANACANLRQISEGGKDRAWEWEQKEFEKEVIHLRRALHGEGFRELPIQRRCQILTNLANAYSWVGRFVEAVEYWDRAITAMPSFVMAVGNRGYGRLHYAQALYDQGHAWLFLKYAHDDLVLALSRDLQEDARAGFDRSKKRIESVLPEGSLGKECDMQAFALGSSEEERRYRQWCLENRLFLNPLNDLGPYPIAGKDVLTTPDVVDAIGAGPRYPACFNQMKQEFVSARYLYYEGIHADQPHFSDREVLLYNTLDYPAYSLAVEKVKLAFRASYSIFDKIAYFLNHYLGLSISERSVNFKTFWYVSESKAKGLKADFPRSKNWALRGLFWLSKDLHHDEPGFKESMAPDARELYEIRNHLEHKYLKLHEDYWPGAAPATEALHSLADDLAVSVYRREFEAKTLRLIKMARAALIYLSLAIHCEERQRERERRPDNILLRTPLDIWEDDWKV